MRSLSCVLPVILCLGNTLLAAEAPLKSGPQPGENIPSAFHPINVTGAHAGERYCLVCENGTSPVVMVFAREVSEPLVRLISRIDAATATHRKHELGSFVVFLSNDESLPARLRNVAGDSRLEHTILSVDDPAGPEGYGVAKDADVTVVLYVEHVVKASHVFRRGTLNDKGIEGVLADLPRILPTK